MPLFNHRSKSRRSSTHIHDIPSEILSQIFIATYPRSIFEPDSEVSSAESILLPRRLSHVCRRWREEAISFGELWSYLYLTEQDIQRDHQRTLDIFLTFLDRSNVSPLNFRFQYYRKYDSFFPPRSDEGELSTLVTITSALLGHQHRWQTVDFMWAYFKVPPHFPKIEIFNIPLVKNLSLQVNLHTHDSKPFPAFINLNHSPRLESFDLCGLYELAIEDGLPNHGILQCQLSPDSLPSSEAARICSYMLKLAPNLRSMVYNTGRDYDWGTHNDEPLESHPLKELYLHSGISHEQILDSVHLPELEKLACGPGVTRFGGRTLLNMIQRSRPPLTSLDMFYPPCDTLFEILRLLPTLVEFTTEAGHSATAMFRALEVQTAMHDGPDGDQTVLCPRLRALHLYLQRGRFNETEGGFTSALFTMLESRMINLGTFNKVFFSERRSHPEYNIRVEVSLQSPDHNIMKQIFNDGGKLSIETSR